MLAVNSSYRYAWDLPNVLDEVRQVLAWFFGAGYGDTSFRNLNSNGLFTHQLCDSGANEWHFMPSCYIYPNRF
ncbi:hypothetical protein NC653_016317 [Populus alba x Populus x berolinensis]|uniref:Uncharacterized protein n=1 Tax=Populus alba x Populus x berolinensis TaxID=444605 RepID=A0AAD6QMM6_9ROSI|nr:hypothetical protein NC653_016317 [Populus alba x Populus x berolinensis]